MQETENKQPELRTPTVNVGTVKCLHCGYGYLRSRSPLMAIKTTETKTKKNKKGKEIKVKKVKKSGDYICKDCLATAVNG